MPIPEDKEMNTTLSFNCRKSLAQPESGRKKRKIVTVYAAMLIGLPVISLIFLYLEHLTHLEFMLHLAAIPLEIMFGAIIVERFLAAREKKGRLRQLIHMKSFFFRSRIREIFINNFHSLVSPQIDIQWLAQAELPELNKLLNELDVLTYRSVEDVETIVVSYIDARDVFETFMEWAIQHDFEFILEDMVFVLSFIQDIRMYRKYHPDMLYVDHVMSTSQGYEKLRRILTDAVSKFLEYAIELKTEKPAVFDDLMRVYLMASELKLQAKIPDSD